RMPEVQALGQVIQSIRILWLQLGSEEVAFFFRRAEQQRREFAEPVTLVRDEQSLLSLLKLLALLGRLRWVFECELHRDELPAWIALFDQDIGVGHVRGEVVRVISQGGLKYLACPAAFAHPCLLPVLSSFGDSIRSTAGCRGDPEA